QAEDGIRDFHVTGVQTCALPICRSFHWYDLPAGWLEGRTFDLLVVDGPPSTGEMNRYPVLPMMAGHLSDRAVVFLDDADRADERSEERRGGKAGGRRSVA